MRFTFPIAALCTIAILVIASESCCAEPLRNGDDLKRGLFSNSVNWWQQYVAKPAVNSVNGAVDSTNNAVQSLQDSLNHNLNEANNAVLNGIDTAYNWLWK